MPNSRDLEKNLPISYRQLEELTNSLEQYQELMSPQAWTRLERAVWGLQTTPLSTMSKKFEEVTLELASQQRKQVHFEAIGFDLDVSESIRSAIDTALLHAIRNAVDHGIESPAERMEAGKPALARIRASVALEQGLMRIAISDDGRGPNIDKIVQKIIEKGLAAPSKLSQATVSQKLSYLCHPGFSTRDVPTELSGRGVGLDAVKAAFDGLSGTLQLRVGVRGGFELEGSLCPEFLGLEATPAWIGDQSFWLQSGGFEVVTTKITEDEMTEACRFAKNLGWTLKDPEIFLRVKSRSAGALLLAVNQVGIPQYKLFRPLDAIWKTTGAPWLKQWIKACRGNGLASRTAQTSAQSSSQIAMLADAGVLQQLMDL